jgi:hypothetical protein
MRTCVDDVTWFKFGIRLRLDGPLATEAGFVDETAYRCDTALHSRGGRGCVFDDVMSIFRPVEPAAGVEEPRGGGARVRRVLPSLTDDPGIPRQKCPGNALSYGAQRLTRAHELSDLSATGGHHRTIAPAVLSPSSSSPDDAGRGLPLPS